MAQDPQAGNKLGSSCLKHAPSTGLTNGGHNKGKMPVRTRELGDLLGWRTGISQSPKGLEPWPHGSL